MRKWVRSLGSELQLAILSAVIFAFAAAIGFFVMHSGRGGSEPVSAEPAPTVVIDAGHGGADGGGVSTAFSDTGAVSVLEKDCNLQISKALAALFRISGYNVVMTRETDIMLDAEGLYGNAKMRDLRARLLIAQKHPDAVFISVHCNKFPDPTCSGLQVYYSEKHEAAKNLAYSIQTSSATLLQPNNKRLPKAAGSSIYVLDRATQPSVLVECGFLSNPEEANLLSDENYQKKLALSILLPVISAEGR